MCFCFFNGIGVYKDFLVIKLRKCKALWFMCFISPYLLSCTITVLGMMSSAVVCRQPKSQPIRLQRSGFIDLWWLCSINMRRTLIRWPCFGGQDHWSDWMHVGWTSENKLRFVLSVISQSVYYIDHGPFLLLQLYLSNLKAGESKAKDNCLCEIMAHSQCFLPWKTNQEPRL